MNETKKIVEKKLLGRGWPIKFDYKRSIMDTIGLTSQMFNYPEERQDFINDCREILEEQGILSREERENREKKREENRKICSELERAFLKAGWPIKIGDKNAIWDIFFASQCKELYEEERNELINIARNILKNKQK